MRFRWTWILLMLVSALSAATGRADAGPNDSPWSVALQAGGSLALGEVEHRVDGKRVRTRGQDLRGAIDLRGSVTRTFGRWFALSGQLGFTNWDSTYRHEGGYERSNYVSIAVSPELRLPLGACLRCPVAYAGPRAGAVRSWLGQDAPHAAVEETSEPAWGGMVGGRIGLQIRFTRRHALGLRLETGGERTWLRHEVELSGIEHQQQRFELTRFSSVVGLWWSP